MSEPKTRSEAINAKCRDCIYDPMSSGTWREQVACCISANCALHAFRPMPRNVTDAASLAKLRATIEQRNRNR